MTEEESIRKLLYILSMSGCGMKWIVEWTLVHLPVDRVWTQVWTTCGPYSNTLPHWPLHLLLGHICLYAYMHKVNPNIFQYFLWFYSCITFISLFAHRSNFVQIFPYFSCHFIHFKSLSFWHSTVNFCFRLGARVPTRRAESNCIIHNARAHLGALSGVEAGGGNRVYVGWDTHSHFPSSVFWQSLRRWEPIVSFPLLY